MRQTTAIATVEFFIPENQKEVVVGELSKQGRRGVSFVIGGLEWWFTILCSQFWPAFRLELSCWEALALAAGFIVAPDRRTYFIAILAGLVGLALRDAHVYPIVKGPIAQGHDTVVGLAFLIGVEMFEWIFAPSYALSGIALLKGCLLSFLTVSMVRATMRQPKNAPAFGASSFRYTRTVTLLWMGAAMFGKTLNRTPELFLFQDNLYTFIPIACFVLARRLQHTDLVGRVIKDPSKLPANDARAELRQMLQWWWTPSRVEGQPVSSHLYIELLAVGAYALPVAGTLLAWRTGYLPESKIDWLVIKTNVITFFALIPLWIAVRRANQNLAVAAIKAATPRARSRQKLRYIPALYRQVRNLIQLRNGQEPSDFYKSPSERYTRKSLESGFKLPKGFTIE